MVFGATEVKKQRDGCAQAGYGAVGLDRDQTLIGRVQVQAEWAERESAKAADCRELEGLLLANPAIARILDLMEKVAR